MMELVHHTDPRLRASNADLLWTPSAAVRVLDMFDLMEVSDGVGLAAPQVGWNARVFVMNHTGKPGDYEFYWNPKVTPVDGEYEVEEGCLSMPSLRVRVRRWERIFFEAEGKRGRIEEEITGKRAQVIQHEVDHLEGRLIVDRAIPSERAGLARKLARLA